MKGKLEPKLFPLLPVPSKRIWVSSWGTTAFTVTHQGDEEPNCEHLPGGLEGKRGKPTLTERNKTPALSSETPAGSLMRRAALQVWNQLREERKTQA